MSLDMGRKLEQPLHPYIRIYIGCKKYGNPMTGAPCLPGPGSYLEQDAELMLAFDVLDDLMKEINEFHTEAEKAKEQFLNGNMQQVPRITLPSS